MLSNLKPSGKFVLGPPVDTEPPVVVFTGPADHPDAAPVATVAVKKRHKGKHTTKTATAETQSAEGAKPAHAKATKTAKTAKTAVADKKTKAKPGAAAQ